MNFSISSGARASASFRVSALMSFAASISIDWAWFPLCSSALIVTKLSVCLFGCLWNILSHRIMQACPALLLHERRCSCARFDVDYFAGSSLPFYLHGHKIHSNRVPSHLFKASSWATTYHVGHRSVPRCSQAASWMSSVRDLIEQVSAVLEPGQQHHCSDYELLVRGLAVRRQLVAIEHLR